MDPASADLIRSLGSCSRCGKSLKKSNSFHVFTLKKRARWLTPVSEERTPIPMPWKEAVGTLCDECASAHLAPYFAAELRGDSFCSYSMVELEDSFTPTQDLVSFVKANRFPFHWSKAPAQVQDAVHGYLAGNGQPEAELAVVRWYVWEFCSGRDSPPDIKRKVSDTDDVSFREFVEKDLKGRYGIDPFAV